MNILSGNIVNIFDGRIEFGVIIIENGRIKEIHNYGIEKAGEKYILPGLIDAHVHIESSMLSPVQFARLSVVHGTVGVVSDPHEIANVLGLDGVKYMIENGRRVPFKFCFGAPSCVPATPFETAGANISSKDIAELFTYKEIGYLAEVMDFPSVLNEDPTLLEKINLAHAYNKPIDGHAPGLHGAAAKKYIDTGIDTDHECFTKSEALEKLHLGMKVLIREGSAAKNFDELIELADEHYDMMMFCSDDKHPNDLVAGHINTLIKRALAKGIDIFKILQMACINPVLHYRMNVGLLRIGDFADCILVDNLTDFNVLETYLNGEKVAENGQSLLPNLDSTIVNNFECTPKMAEDFRVIDVEEDLPNYKIRVIEAIDNQLITNELFVKPIVNGGFIVSDITQDILKIAVVNRYKDVPPVVGFIKNFGLKQGAIASSVGHDSHNIIAVGVDEQSIAVAVNLIIREKGGVAAVSNNQKGVLSLPIAGIMSNEDGYKIAKNYTKIDRFAKDVLGSQLSSPFMTLSFMSLLVIPNLKLSDLGLFDGNKFEFVSNFYQKLKAEMIE